MESTIRIYDGERLIEHCVPFDAAYTIGKGINSTIRYEANWLGKKTLQIRTRADSWDVVGAGIKHTNVPYEKTVVLCAEEHVAIAAFLRRAEKNVLISLLDADRVTVGRNSDCDIQISDPRYPHSTSFCSIAMVDGISRILEAGTVPIIMVICRGRQSLVSATCSQSVFVKCRSVMTD